MLEIAWSKLRTVRIAVRIVSHHYRGRSRNLTILSATNSLLSIRKLSPVGKDFMMMMLTEYLFLQIDQDS